MVDVGYNIEVRSLGELVRRVAEITAATNAIHWYRGQRDATWDLQPSAFRVDGSEQERKEIERNSMHLFRSRAGIRYHRNPSFEDIAGWISLMQHYGLPTRLLDWSRSPLVAAYFALERYIYDAATSPTDACIWMLQPHLLNSWLGLPEITVSIDSGRCRRDIEPAFYNESEEPGRVQAVMASESDLRMFVQQGAFTIHSTQRSFNRIQSPPGILRRCVVPADAVEGMAVELAVAGFRKGDLFPDLQSLADDLNNFRPRWQAMKGDA